MRRITLQGILLVIALFLTGQTQADMEAVINLPAGVDFPEGIAIAADGTMFVGSITNGSFIDQGIVGGAITRQGPGDAEPEIFVAAGTFVHGVIGLAVDEDRDILWVCDASPLFGAPATAIVGVSMSTGDILSGYTHPIDPVPGYPVLCNDLIVVDGDLLATESFGGRVVRVAEDDVGSGSTAEDWAIGTALQAMEGGPPFGANGIVNLNNTIYVSNFGNGTLVEIPYDDIEYFDCSAGDCATEVALFDKEGASVRLVGPDGMVVVGNQKILVAENGMFNQLGFGNTLTSIKIPKHKSHSRDGRDKSATVKIIALVDTPTTVAIGQDDDIAWVVVGQFDHLFQLAPFNEVETPFKVVPVELED